MLKAQCSQVQDRGGKNRWQGTQAKCRRIFLISVRFLNNSNIFHAVNNVPQPRKLMRSSAQNSCGVHWSRRRSGSTRFWRRFRRLGGLGAEPGHVQQGSGEGSRKPWCKAKSSSTGSGEGSGEGSRKLWQAKSSSTGSGEGCREGSGEGFGNLWCRARSCSKKVVEKFVFLAFAARFRKSCENKTCCCWGYHRSFFHFSKTFLFFSSFKL